MKARRTEDNQLATVKGILIPVDWDEDGNVRAVGVAGTDEEEYLIESNDNREMFLRLIRTEVEVHGLLSERAGKKIITVKSYKVF